MGANVEVRSSFDGRWCGGYVVVDAETCGEEVRYRLQRVSDGRVLPELLSEMDVAPAGGAPS